MKLSYKIDGGLKELITVLNCFVCAPQTKFRKNMNG